MLNIGISTKGAMIMDCRCGLKIHNIINFYFSICKNMHSTVDDNQRIDLNFCIGM